MTEWCLAGCWAQVRLFEQVQAARCVVMDAQGDLVEDDRVAFGRLLGAGEALCTSTGSKMCCYGCTV